VAPHIVPTGWTCPDELKPTLAKLLPQLEDVIHAKARPFKRIPGLNHFELLQEARIAAIYAVATHKPERGRALRTWVDLVVRNALLAIVNYELALKRAPRIDEGDGVSPKHQRLAGFGSTAENDADMTDPACLEATQEHEQQAWVTERVIQRLDEVDRLVLSARLCPPPELEIMARNVRPGKPTITESMLAEHLGIPAARVKSALARARQALREA